MNCEAQFDPWQTMYNQLLKEYSTLAHHYHQQTQTNLSLYSQLQELLQERITLLEEPSIPTVPSLPLLTINHAEEHLQIAEGRKQKHKGKRKLPRHRIRRNGEMWQCPYNGCKLTYHSSISLNLHIKAKHNGGTKQEREAFAIKLLESEQKGIPPPESNLNLPPNFLEEFRRTYSYNKKYKM